MTSQNEEISTDSESPVLVNARAMLIPTVKSSRATSSSSPYLYLVVGASFFATLNIGYSVGYSSSAIPKMQRDGVLQEETWFGSLLNIGAILGGPIAGVLLGKIGRKATLMACAVPYAVGWAFIVSFVSLEGLYAGRLLTGIGVGMSSLCCPVYIAEVTNPDNRGFLGSFPQLVGTFGVLLVYVLGMPLSYIWLAVVPGFLSLLLAVFMLPMPDTPRYLLMKHKRERALSVLRRLRGPTADIDEECHEIETTLENANDDESQLEALFNRHIIWPFVISMALMFFQQFSGINAVMFYAVQIFKSTGSSFSPHVSSIIIGAVQVAATAVAVLLTDRLGRKILLITSGLLMALSSTTFGLYFSLTEASSGNTTVDPSIVTNTRLFSTASTSDLGWLSLASMITYIVGFSLGLGPIPWVVMSEIFPTKARGVASSIATAFNWTCSFIVTKEFSTLEDRVTIQGVFWIFAGICTVGALFVFVFVPETKGKSLEEIEVHFKRKAFDVSSISNNLPRRLKLHL